MKNETIIETILEKKIIAICRLVPVNKILETGWALYKGGVRLVEVTFQEGHAEETMESIRKLTAEFGEKLLVGAGTVTSADQVEKAADAGALYIISPNTDPDVIRKTKELGLVSIPGAMSPSEMLQAWNCGADFVKIFPAAQLGVSYIKAVRAPIDNIPLLAVGGIDKSNMQDFINVGILGFGIGSNIVDKKLIAAGEFDKLTKLALEYTAQFD